MTPEDEIPEHLADTYDPNEVFMFDGTLEDLADALLRERK